MNVIIIGAGAAGLMSAVISKKEGNNVTLIEKMSNIGNKIKITGKGRCNLTFNGDFEYFKNNVTVNNKFLYSAFSNFSNIDLINFVNNELNVKTKLERGNRIFLESDNAKELVDKFLIKLKELNINVKYNEKVIDIITENNSVKKVITDKNEYLCDKCILATGGKSYPGTGSTGDGYIIAKRLGHNIIQLRSALVPLKSNDNICKELQGLTLKNISIKVLDNNKVIYNDFGEMLFAHFGLTGPVILSSSSKINRVKDLDNKLSNNLIKVVIDLKPALSYEMLDKRVQRDFEKYCNKEFKNSLDDLLPKKLINVIVSKSNIDQNKKVNQISKNERENLVKLLKNLEINISSLMDIETGIVTAGGVDVKEVNPKTMESKLINGLYFAGEILDLDAYTGGFNLQIAFSTGCLAGKNN